MNLHCNSFLKKVSPLSGQGAYALRLLLANLIADSAGSFAGRLTGSLAFSTAASLYCFSK